MHWMDAVNCSKIKQATRKHKIREKEEIIIRFLNGNAYIKIRGTIRPCDYNVEGYHDWEPVE